MKDFAVFTRESDLCHAFIDHLPKDWTAYPETGNFDILLVRSDGAQIGIEAKLALNAKVIEQIVGRTYSHYSASYPSPDFRAILVPWGKSGGLKYLCGLINITVIEMASDDTYKANARYSKERFRPLLPDIDPKKWYWREDDWLDWCPTERVKLPDYIPDVRAGETAPTALTEWKIKAIKIVIILEKRGYVGRSDFSFLNIDASRWINFWLERGGRKGCFVAGPATPDFRKIHPKNYLEIEADFEKWAPADLKKVSKDGLPI